MRMRWITILAMIAATAVVAAAQGQPDFSKVAARIVPKAKRGAALGPNHAAPSRATSGIRAKRGGWSS